MSKKRKKREYILLRLNLLFLTVFLAFSILIFQLGTVQILHGEEYQNEIDRTTKDTVEESTPRGEIYDRNGNLMVENKPLYSITYTPTKDEEATDRLNIAKKLSKFLTMYDEEDKEEQFDSITENEKKEFWYLHHEDQAESLLSDKEAASMDSGEQYETTLDRINEDDIDDLSEEDKNVILIKKEMDKAQSLTPQIIKDEDVTTEEYATVAEHLSDLPGVDASTEWERKYPYKDTFKSLLGSVTSHKEGIPAEEEEKFLARGYEKNDRVGKSGLEEQYESLLQGRKERKEYTTNRSNEIIDSNVAVEGEPGKDLVMSIDMDFQEEVDKILHDELEKVIKKHPHENRFTEEAMAVVMDPQTGELLAVSGQHYDRDEKKFSKEASKALHVQHEPGSSVKGATVLSGYQSKVIKPGKTFEDKPMKIAGTPEKSSYKTLGTVDDISALRQSSNVYMFHIALRMGGEYHYERNKPITFNSEAFQEFRNYFRQFGLGVSTGIDYPDEGIGYEGTDPDPGNLLDFAIGQYDTVTTLQLAQYVSTIANDGKRVTPHFLRKAHFPPSSDEKLGPVFNSFSTDILNDLEMKPEHIKRVQKGFRQVYQETGGTAYDQFSDKDYDPAGKTGTAEVDVVENDTLYEKENNSLVGYAPYDDPEIAMAIMVPHTGIDKGDDINNKIGEKIMDTYFDSKKESDD